MKSSKVTLVDLLAVFFVLVVSGCRVFSPVGNFVSQRYTNVVSYFNTFYNAQQTFDAGEADVTTALQSQRGSAAGGLTQQQEANLVSANARQKFTTAIEKASKLLSFYPKSKFVDDALMMIGKSYYYLNDDLKAERKFLELFAKFPGSSLIPEAEVWYGRTLLREKKYADALTVLDKNIASAEGRGAEKFGAQAAITLGRYYTSVGDYRKAVGYFQKAIDLSGDGVLNAETQLRIGFCYSDLGDYPRAEQAFDSVDDFSPDYYTQFQSEFQRAKMLGRMKHDAEAIGALDILLNDRKNYENFSKIQLAIADIYLAEGRTDDAVSKYTYIDTTYARTDEAARSYYNLGMYYEYQRSDYAKARTNYEKARAEYPPSEITKDASARAEMFTRYFNLNIELTKDDSILAYIGRQRAIRDSIARLPDSLRDPVQTAQQDSLVRKSSVAGVLPDSVKSDSLSAARAVASVRRDSLRTADSLKAKAEEERLAAEQTLVDSMKHSAVRTEFELGDLFYLDIEQPDSALYWYQKVVTESPLSEYAPRALYTLADIYRSAEKKDTVFQDSLFSLIVKNYPRSPYAQDARKALGLPLLVEAKDPAEGLYLHAEECFDSTQAGSAMTILDSIARTYRTSHLAPKSLYSIGWLYEYELGKKDSASAVYRKLLALYPDSKYAVAVRPMILAEDQQKMEEERAAKAAAEKAAAEKAAAEKAAEKSAAEESAAGKAPHGELKKMNTEPQKADTSAQREVRKLER
ncbi:MAG: tetratricopeptide repeat protein [Bacteroidota bacterium]|nr:tetratricopeptide repeat protein [Bacteroidota bacterium]